MHDPKYNAHSPYKILGTRLKYVREHNNESLVEVSGAVEIEPEALARIEDGFERPTEDILMLLINHFNVQDPEAVRLWELAGYDNNDTNRSGRNEQIEKIPLLVLAMDVRTLYTDGISIDAGRSGLVLNFTQVTSDKSQPVTISRVGMSYDQAQEVLKTLQRAMLYGPHQSGPRRLPPPKQT